uniref:Uncharacterized protein n=1 Tax=viral metagenome TaxID=1070528 RepID=A0A6M3L760_9ZZZZ
MAAMEKITQTIMVYDDYKLLHQWEPWAALIDNRIMAIHEASKMGIYTWVSVEPVFNANQALHVMIELRDVVDHWKVGKLNHNKWYEDQVNWGYFLMDTEMILRDRDVYIKEDLLMAARGGAWPKERVTHRERWSIIGSKAGIVVSRKGGL